MPTIFVDCSCLSQSPHLNTGIQRVVRNLVKHLPNAAQAVQYNVVVVDLSVLPPRAVHQDTLSAIVNAPPRAAAAPPGVSGQVRRFAPRVLGYAKRLFDASCNFVAALVPHHKVRAFFLNPSYDPGLRALLLKLVLGPMRRARGRRAAQAALPAQGPDVQVAVPVPPLLLEAQPGDVLFLVDASWQLNVWGGVEWFKGRGVKVVGLVYDLLPILRPQYFDDALVKVFRQWIDGLVAHTDHCMCISQTVCNKLAQFIEFAHPVARQRIGLSAIKLGADFVEQAPPAQQISERLQRAFANPAFLVVSTIEPRKNHQLLLDTFEQLWASGFEVNLVMVGKRGWKVDDLLLRIDSHPLLNQKLFFLENTSDEELRAAYAGARCLLCPSFDEGYGLPIVEALLHGTPVMASRIEVFMEVGGDLIKYFDPASVQELYDLIVANLQHGATPKPVAGPQINMVTWAQCAREVVEQLRQGSAVLH